MAGENYDLKVPSLGESVIQATVVRWLKNEGESVKMDETLVELETEKVTLDVAAPVAGVLSQITAAAGEVVVVGGLLGRINQNVTANASEPTKPVLSSVVEDEPAATAAVPAPTAPAAPSAAAPVISAGVTAPAAVTGSEERVPMTILRRKIAERLKMAQNTAAILTTFNEADMSAVNELRTHYKQTFEEKYGIKLGFMSFFVKACTMALHEFPAVNAAIDGDDIIYKNYYDIGVAVSTPKGLVVPVVRHVDQLSFADIEKNIAALSEKARNGKLEIADLTGGTFTISNGGIFGSLMSTPILNPPQSAILGMHKIQERAVVIDGTIHVRPMMYLALSYDHRMVDGREAVTFLVRVKELIENPDRLLLEV